MAKVFIEETTLSAIGDAIRSKTGKTALIDPAQMHTEIASITTGGGGSDIEVEPIVLTGNCEYGCAGPLVGAYINMFSDTISTSNISDSSYMFYNNSGLTRVPFEINMKANEYLNMEHMFHDCKNLKHIPDMTITSPASHFSMASMFNNCTSLESLPYIYNAYPSSMMQMFIFCSRLRYIPDDYFDTWDFSRMTTYTSANQSYMFNSCHSLRKIPTSLFARMNDQAGTSSSSRLYGQAFGLCYALDEITNLPAISGNLTSNAFSQTFNTCYRLKRLVFACDADGTPKVRTWKSQTIDLSRAIGYCNSYTNITGYNSGITADKRVFDDATYQALKNDPDWFTDMIEYSRYNHDSAVETINSLPDVSAGSGNTIKFEGAAGSLTDGGAINTLTEAEIAVAATKGWTVTLV